MPCDSSYFRPTDREQELQRAAKMLVYVRKQTGQKPEAWVVRESRNEYASDDRSVTELCATLTAMPRTQRDEIIYGNPRSKLARNLADWWEEHKAADARRRRQQAAGKKRKKASKKVAAKSRKKS